MPRVPIPVVGPAYENRELPLSAQVTKNLWPEINPDSRAVVALHHTPGCNPFASLAGADRGMHLFNERLICVSGTGLYEVFSDGTDSLLGTIPGSARVQFADDGSKLVLVTAGNAYIYTDDDGVATISDDDLTNPTTVAYINQQFLFDTDRGVPGQFVVSEVTVDFNIDGLDFARAESHPDDIVRLITFRQHVFMFGQRSVEPWYNTGTGRPPFARVNNALRPYGIAGINAANTTSEWLYFLDHNRIPRRTTGLEYQNIGNPALGVEFSKYGVVNDCIIFHYIQDNQTFVVFTFPTEDRTWVYHEPSNSWFQWSYGVNDARSLANSCVNAFGAYYVADHSSGSVYYLDPCCYTDNGDVIQRRRTTKPIHGGLYEAPGKTLFFDRVEFIVAYGDCRTRPSERVSQDGVVTGICGDINDVTTYDTLLEPTPPWIHRGNSTPSWYYSDGDPAVNSESWNDTKEISFTAGWNLDSANPPTAGQGAYFIAARKGTVGADANYLMRVYIDENGHFRVRAKNSANTEILNMALTNGGGSFADDTTHMIALTIDLSSAANRQVILDGVDVTDNCTWTTYTDDLISLATTAGDGMVYDIGYFLVSATATLRGWQATAFGDHPTSSNFCLLSFDDSCSLVAPAVFDENNFVREFGLYEGWFIEQPRVFFPGALYSVAHLGTTQMGWPNEWQYTQSNSVALIDARENETAVNFGMTSNVATGYSTSASRVDPPEDVDVLLVQPHWLNLPADIVNTGEWDVYSWASVFGADISASEGAEDNYTVNRAISATTTDENNKVTIVNSTQCSSAALVLCDATGAIVDYCYQDGTSVINGTSVTIPSDGSNYLLIASSDTGSARLRWWDSG